MAVMLFSRTLKRLSRFRLRTLLAIVTLANCWLGYTLHWDRERERFLNDRIALPVSTTPLSTPAAPWQLRYLRTEGIYALLLATEASEVELARARSLFPEAQIVCFPSDPDVDYDVGVAPTKG